MADNKGPSTLEQLMHRREDVGMPQTDWALRAEKNEQITDEDREGWGPGQWSFEPDVVEWRHAGLPCLIVRNRMGALCGYAGVPPGHPLHGKSDDEVYTLAPGVGAHGGLTFSSECTGHICHVAQPGEPEHVWWLGFDCAHCGDMVPGLNRFRSEHSAISGSHEDYRDLTYVRGEVEDLAEQLAEVARG